MKDFKIDKELSTRCETSDDVADFTLSKEQSKKERRSSFMRAVSKANTAYKQGHLAHA